MPRTSRLGRSISIRLGRTERSTDGKERQIPPDELGAELDPVRRGQLGLCADGGHPYPHFLQCAGGSRGPELGGVSGLLGLCQLGCDRYHGCFEPHFGDSGRHEGLQEAYLHTLRFRGHRGLLRHGRGVGVAAVSGHLRHCESGLFGQPGVLRLDAQRRDHSRADGRSVQPGLCVGIHRQLRTLRGLPRSCAGGGEHWHQPDDGAEPGTPADGGVVAAHDPAAAEKL